MARWIKLKFQNGIKEPHSIQAFTVKLFGFHLSIIELRICENSVFLVAHMHTVMLALATWLHNTLSHYHVS